MIRTGPAALVMLLAAWGTAVSQDRMSNAYEAWRSGRYSDARSLYREAWRSDRYPAAIKALVALEHEVGRYHEALRTVEQALSEVSDSAQLLTTLGEARFRLGLWPEAEVAFRAALAGSSRDKIPATFRLAELAWADGRRDSAVQLYGSLVGSEESSGLSRDDRLWLARAMVWLGRAEPSYFRRALRSFDRIIAEDSTRLDAMVAVGDLFLSKFNGTDAEAMYRTALARNPKHPGALLGLARVTRFGGGAVAFGLTERSLEANDNNPEVRAFLARQYLDLEDIDQAESEAEAAVAESPASVEGHSMLMAAALLRNDSVAMTQRRATAAERGALTSQSYVALAEVAERNRLYHTATQLAARAIDLDSLNWRGWALRGVNFLRTSDMVAGRRDLEIAFAGDPFDVWTKNTLDLLDDLDGYHTVVTERFAVVIPEAEAGILPLYLGPLAEAAYDSLAARYGVSLPTPVRIEVFPRHADFSVRTIGLVGLGALGVSFGPVIALDAPSARPAGEFHWGSTLWHELAHSFHMHLSGYRVPRWFTEGLAVYEERRARPGWGDRTTPDYLMAYLEDRLAPVTDLNRGFMRPEYPQQIGHSYYQASLVHEFISERWGFVQPQMLKAYAAGLATPNVVRQVLGIDLDRFGDEYDAWFRGTFAGPLAAIKPFGENERMTRQLLEQRVSRDSSDFLARFALGQALLTEDRARGLALLEQAKSLYPEFASGNSPYLILAKAHHSSGSIAKAMVELTELTRRNAASYEAQTLLAELRAATGDTLGAVAALDAAQYIYPYDDEAHRRLAAWADVVSPETAVRERQAVLAARPFNRAEAYYLLARSQFLAGLMVEARSSVLSALEEAPNYREALELLRQIRAARR